VCRIEYSFTECTYTVPLINVRLPPPPRPLPPDGRHEIHIAAQLLVIGVEE
jgi:hypothetical protein